MSEEENGKGDFFDRKDWNVKKEKHFNRFYAQIEINEKYEAT